MNFNIGFVGAGKVGVSLGKYFSVHNLKLSGYYSKNKISAKEAARFTNSSFYAELEDLVKNCNVIFITTPDDVILKIWTELKKYNLKDKIICHASGSLSSSIFSSINTLGAFGYSTHPMCAFSDKFSSYKSLDKVYFSIEGDELYLNELKNFFQLLGNNVIIIDKDKKPLYHLASVTVSNLILSLLDIGCKYLVDCNVDAGVAISALMPLIESNINNIKESGFVNALTGPIERMDLETIKRHLSVIPAEDIQLYKHLSLTLINLSERKHPNGCYNLIRNELDLK